MKKQIGLDELVVESLDAGSRWEITPQCQTGTAHPLFSQRSRQQSRYTICGLDTDPVWSEGIMGCYKYLPSCITCAGKRLESAATTVFLSWHECVFVCVCFVQWCSAFLSHKSGWCQGSTLIVARSGPAGQAGQKSTCSKSISTSTCTDTFIYQQFSNSNKHLNTS